MPKLKRNLSLLFILALVLLAGLINLEHMPPLWWDEGWTLQVAKNWVEHGHYGRMINGEPTTSRLSAGFPVVAAIALSFEFLGVGVWQGRLPGVFFTLFAILFVFLIAEVIYNRKIAFATLGVVLFMPLVRYLHPILVGRQVLGEMPAIFFLLGGYALFILAFNRNILYILLASLVWGFALVTKSQVHPFLLVGLLLPLFYALFKSWWKSAFFFTIAILGSLVFKTLLSELRNILLRDISIQGEPIIGLIQVTGFIPDIGVRWVALVTGLTLGFPSLLGILFAAREFLNDFHDNATFQVVSLVRFSLLVLVCSWFAWYLLFGNVWIRYLFPSVFLSSFFLAALLNRLTGGFNLSYIVNKASDLIWKLNIKRETLGAIFAILLLATTVPLTLLTLFTAYTEWFDPSVFQAADYLESTTPPSALIETYESELIFLTKRKFHFPPDQVHVDLIRRSINVSQNILDYDPLISDPDFLVVGSYSKTWNLYSPLENSEDFILIRSFNLVDIYERDR